MDFLRRVESPPPPSSSGRPSPMWDYWKACLGAGFRRCEKSLRVGSWAFFRACWKNGCGNREGMQRLGRALPGHHERHEGKNPTLKVKKNIKTKKQTSTPGFGPFPPLSHGKSVGFPHFYRHSSLFLHSLPSFFTLYRHLRYKRHQFAGIKALTRKIHFCLVNICSVVAPI